MVNFNPFTGQFTLTPLGSLQIDGAGKVLSPSSIAFGAKLATAFQGADLAIAGADPTTNKSIYSSINHSGSGTYARKTLGQNFFAAFYNPTCVSVYSSTGVFLATLVAKDTIITANHIGPTVGEVLRFVALDNTVVERTIIATGRVLATDIQVCVLNADVPDSIVFAKVLNTPIEQFMRGCPTLWVDQSQNCYIDEIAPGTVEIGLNQSQFARRTRFYKLGVGGDSGAPSFLLLDGTGEGANVTPVLLGCRHEPGACSWISNNFDAVNAKMTVLGSRYQLTTYNKTILAPYGPQPGSATASDTLPAGQEFVNWRGVLSLSAGSTLVGADNNVPGLYDANGQPILWWQNTPNRVEIVDTASLYIGNDKVLVGDALHDFVHGEGFLVFDNNLSDIDDPAEAVANLGLKPPFWSRVITQFNKVGDTVFANIPGLVANVAAGKAYAIRAVVYVSQSGDNPGKLSVFGTATATSFIGRWMVPDVDNGTLATQQATMFNDDDTDMEFVGNDGDLAIFEGTIVANAAGTLAVRGATQGDGQLHVLPGSTLMVQEIP